MRGKHFFQDWWAHLPVPKGASIFMACAYMMFVVQGIVNFASPGENAWLLIDWQRFVVNMVLVVGGMIGAFSALRGLWLFERPAIILVGGMYVVHALWVVTDADNDGDVYWQVAIRMTIIILLLCKRYMQIRWALLDPHTATHKKVG